MTKILLTGASGFLGTIISNNLSEATITTLGRGPDLDINCNLSVEIPDLQPVNWVIHAAGKAHMVCRVEADMEDFYNVNVKGTLNLLHGLERSACLPESFIFISSVAVYGDNGKHINEEHPFNPTDAYGKSKIEAEILIQEWCIKNNVNCSILRLPLLAGPHPPGNLGAMIKGQQKGYYFNINGGQVKKSLVMAEDVAKIIPKAAKIGGIFNLTDGYHPSFSELSKVIAKQLNKPVPYNIPEWIAKIMAKFGDLMGSNAPINSKKYHKIMSELTFDDSKARKILKWNPQLVLEAFKLV